VIQFSPLYVEVLPNGRTYEVTRDFVVEMPGRKFIVPSGFETDFASVPLGLWNIFPPFGRYSKAAVLHDYLYRCSKLERSYCDGVFLKCMEALGVSWWRRTAMYYGVRLFGGFCR